MNNKLLREPSDTRTLEGARSHGEETVAVGSLEGMMMVEGARTLQEFGCCKDSEGLRMVDGARTIEGAGSHEEKPGAVGTYKGEKILEGAGHYEDSQECEGSQGS